MSALRSANYDPHDCISTYMNVGETGKISRYDFQNNHKILNHKHYQIDLPKFIITINLLSTFTQ